jgi:hypothetical protein
VVGEFIGIPYPFPFPCAPPFKLRPLLTDRGASLLLGDPALFGVSLAVSDEVCMETGFESASSKPFSPRVGDSGKAGELIVSSSEGNRSAMRN